MSDPTQVREGMVVRSADGEKLGKVLQVMPDGFIAEKGFFFPKDYFCRLIDVSDVRDDEIYLRYRREEMEKLASAPAEEGRADLAGEPSSAPSAAATASPARPPAAAAIDARTEEQRIPLAEEEIVAEKQTRQAGEVRVRKEVVTEMRQVTVPVTREEVKVEVVRTDPAAGTPERAFEEGEVTVPVMEEDVQIGKRTVARGEARITKEAREEQVSASETVRREEIDIEETGEVRRTPAAGEDEEPLSAGAPPPERGRR